MGGGFIMFGLTTAKVRHPLISIWLQLLIFLRACIDYGPVLAVLSLTLAWVLLVMFLYALFRTAIKQ
jgi:hypothetical protein